MDQYVIAANATTEYSSSYAASLLIGPPDDRRWNPSVSASGVEMVDFQIETPVVASFFSVKELVDAGRISAFYGWVSGSWQEIWSGAPAMLSTGDSEYNATTLLASTTDSFRVVLNISSGWPELDSILVRGIPPVKQTCDANELAGAATCVGQVCDWIGCPPGESYSGPRPVCEESTGHWRAVTTSGVCIPCFVELNTTRCQLSAFNATYVEELISLSDPEKERHVTFELASGVHECVECPLEISGHRIDILAAEGATLDMQMTTNAMEFFGSDINLYGITFINGNRSDARGGAIDTVTSIVTIRDCHFLNNHALGGGLSGQCKGGAIHSRINRLHIYDSSFVNNSIGVDGRACYGGAIYAEQVPTLAGISDDALLLDNCYFKGNYASWEGGAIFADDINGVIANTIFEADNVAGGYGHAVAVVGLSIGDQGDLYGSTMLFTNCSIRAPSTNVVQAFNGVETVITPLFLLTEMKGTVYLSEDNTGVIPAKVDQYSQLGKDLATVEAHATYFENCGRTTEYRNRAYLVEENTILDSEGNVVPDSFCCSPGSHRVAPYTCALCPPGQFGYPGFESTQECLTCQPGRFLPNSGSFRESDCLACVPGKVSARGSDQCVQCLPGTFTDDSTRCTTCAPGRYTDESTVTENECVSCPPQHAAEAGSSECVGCTEGKYVSEDGASCIPCPAGTFATGASCEPCARGEVSNVSSSACTPCPPGSAPGPLNEQCLSCPRGTASADAGELCQVCPLKSYSIEEGSFECLSGCENCLLASADPSPKSRDEHLETLSRKAAGVSALSSTSSVSGRLSVISSVLLGVGIGGVCLLLLVAALMRFLCKPAFNAFARVDYMFPKHHVVKRIPSPLIVRRSAWGGFFTIATGFVFFCYGLYMFIEFSDDNVSETVTVIPGLALFTLRPTYWLRVSAIGLLPDVPCVEDGSAGPGPCAGNITISHSAESDFESHCIREDSTCTVEWRCPSCLSPGETNVYVSFNGGNAMAQRVGFALVADGLNGMPSESQNNRVFGVVTAQDANGSAAVFQGDAPSRLGVTVHQVEYLDLTRSAASNLAEKPLSLQAAEVVFGKGIRGKDDGFRRYGYALSSSLLQPGETRDPHSAVCFRSPGLHFQLTLTESDSHIRRTLSSRQSPVTFLGAFAGALGGLFTVFALGLRCFESFNKSRKGAKDRFASTKTVEMMQAKQGTD